MAILVRPMREQVEHDRVIRVLQARWRRRFAVEANTGEERTASIRVGDAQLYPDLILTQSDGGRRSKPHAIVEVETGESINHLEAMAQWVRFSKARTRFYLYVPEGSMHTTRRLCADHHVTPSEIWSYLPLGEQVRFTQIFRAARRGASAAAAEKPRQKTAARATRAGTAAAKASAKRTPAKGVKPAKAAKSAKAASPAKRVSKTARGAKRAAKGPARASRVASRAGRAAAARKAPPARAKSTRRSAKPVRAQKRR